MHCPLLRFQTFVALLTLLLFFSSFCTHSVCCQFCFEVLCYSVRREIYFSWLLLALLPLWRSGNVHLWQSLLRFSSLSFLPLHTLYISVWSLLFSLESLQLSHFSLGTGVLGVKCFCTEGGCDKTVCKSCLLQWGLWGQPVPDPTDPAGFPTEHLPGTPWSTVTKEWGMTSAAPSLWICTDIPMFHHPLVFYRHFLRLIAV